MNSLTAKIVVDRIQYKNWKIHIEEEELEGCTIVISRCVVDSDKPDQEAMVYTRSRFTKLSMDSFDIPSFVRFVYHLILDAEYHEAGEFFRYKGERVFHPHKDKDNG